MKKKVVIISNIIILGFLTLFGFVAEPFKASKTVSVNSNVIYQGNTEQNKVCFMINVYWGTEYISSDKLSHD